MLGFFLTPVVEQSSLRGTVRNDTNPALSGTKIKGLFFILILSIKYFLFLLQILFLIKQMFLVRLRVVHVAADVGKIIKIISLCGRDGIC